MIDLLKIVIFHSSSNFRPTQAWTAVTKGISTESHRLSAATATGICRPLFQCFTKETVSLFEHFRETQICSLRKCRSSSFPVNLHKLAMGYVRGILAKFGKADFQISTEFPPRPQRRLPSLRSLSCEVAGWCWLMGDCLGNSTQNAMENDMENDHL